MEETAPEHCDGQSSNLDNYGRWHGSRPARSGCSKFCSMNNVNARIELTMHVSQREKRGKSRQRRSKNKLKKITDEAKNAMACLKKTTKKSWKRMKHLYKSIGGRRAVGFNCDLTRCESTITECSVSSCKKPGMIFGKVESEENCGGTSPTVCGTGKRSRGKRTRDEYKELSKRKGETSKKNTKQTVSRGTNTE